MAQNIEDPEIARAIDELKSRWPAVGEAADHPLTEWFIRRKDRNRTSNMIKAILMLILIYGAILCFNYSNHGVTSVLFIGGSAAYYVILLSRRKEKKKSLEDIEDIYLDTGDVSQAQQIWVTPLNFRSIVGIEIGDTYYNEFGPKWPLSKKIPAWIACATIASMIVYAFRMRIMTWIDNVGGGVNFGIMVICGFVLILSLYKLCSSRGFIICERMKEISSNIMARERGLRAFVRQIGAQWRILLLCVMGLVNFVILMAFRKTHLGPGMDLSFLLWSAAAIVRLLQYEHRNINDKFEDFVRSTEPEYLALFRQKVGGEF